jgi:2-polyprenyl-6-hydroxyphenyl methylase/3-demethylubiquinone-9 3-methyltransferase
MVANFVGRSESIHFAVMDAVQMGFQSQSFDLTICIQNGISAFSVDQKKLFAEAVRVTRRGGTVLFSSYSQRFWAERLRWFEIQAEHGFIGEIDHGLTGDGVIVCKDGFRATTVDSEGFMSLAAGLGLMPDIIEVDGSSLFCEIVVT